MRNLLLHPIRAIKNWLFKRKTFSIENWQRIDLEQSSVSRSGRYCLTVYQCPTEKGCWNWTVGLVLGSDGRKIAEVKRNYSRFWACWVENHPDGNDYLVCGEDYQGQTIVNLTTGQKKSYLPKAAAEGYGFCWADVKYDREHNLLVVDGCYWACPYELVTYDFSQPWKMPWPELKRQELVECCKCGCEIAYDYKDEDKLLESMYCEECYEYYCEECLYDHKEECNHTARWYQRMEAERAARLAATGLVVVEDKLKE